MWPTHTPWVSTRKTRCLDASADTLVRSIASQMALSAVSHPSDQLRDAQVEPGLGPISIARSGTVTRLLCDPLPIQMY
jgi:hypothetical protein